MIEIVWFNKKYSEQFFILNKAWIEESWHLEDSDKKDLLNPDKIIEKGELVKDYNETILKETMKNEKIDLKIDLNE